MLNFTFTVTEPPDRKWGTHLGNGSWNGMIQQLMDRHADFGNLFHLCRAETISFIYLDFLIGVADFSVTHQRSQVVSFGPTILRNSKQYFVQNPVETFNVWAFIEPLSTETWIAIFILCLGLPPILHLTIQ